MRTALVWVLILVSVTILNAETRWIDIERSTVTVYISASRAQAAAGTDYVIEAPVAEGSVNDTNTPHLALLINVDQLRVVDPGRSVDERQEVREQMLGPARLDIERFSRITYHSLTIDRVETDVWFIQGELQMHGQFLPLNVRAVRQGDQFTGTTTVSLTGFGIPPILVERTNVPIDKEVRVSFDIVLETP